MTPMATGETIEAKLHELDPGPQTPAVVRMVVEIPKNSVNKYEYDRALGVFRLDRTLYSPMHYPGDYGFIPSTVAEDHDPLDILLLTDEGSFPGCIVYARPIALLDLMDASVLDRKIIAVPSRNPRYDEVKEIDEVAPHVAVEIEHFFNVYKALEAKHAATKGWCGAREACEAIVECRRRYIDAQSSVKWNQSL